MNLKRACISGFTLVEIMVTLAIILIILSVVVGSFIGLKNNQIVSKSAHSVSVLLSEARSLTLSSKEESRYGVHFASDSATLYKNSYQSGNSDNKIVEVVFPAEISGISLNGGGSNVIFTRLTGETGNSGTVTITSSSDTNDVKTITIHPSGLIEIN